MPPLPTDSPRYALRDHYREELTEAATKVEGGPWDGRMVVDLDRIREILDGRIPPSSDHGAEVRTPGKVVVTAVCPQCGETAEVSLGIATVLHVEEDAAALQLKGKSKKASHVCGQTSLSFPDGQETAFELEDIVGSDDSPDETPSDDPGPRPRRKK